MKLWLSAELSCKVLSQEQLDQERIARNFVEETLNSRLLNESYDIPIQQWNCIGIIMGENDFDERIYYSPKRKDMDFRLKIDPIAFKSTDDLGRERLIFAMLLRSLDLLKAKFEKARPKFDPKVYDELERLRNDALEVAKEKNWV